MSSNIQDRFNQMVGTMGIVSGLYANSPMGKGRYEMRQLNKLEQARKSIDSMSGDSNISNIQDLAKVAEQKSQATNKLESQYQDRLENLMNINPSKIPQYQEKQRESQERVDFAQINSDYLSKEAKERQQYETASATAESYADKGDIYTSAKQEAENNAFSRYNNEVQTQKSIKGNIRNRKKMLQLRGRSK